MKKSELQQGMMVQTTHNRYGFVEIDKNRIDFCYDPDVLLDEYANLEKVSLDNVFEFGNGQLGIGSVLTQEQKDRDPEIYEKYNVGEPIIYYEIIACYTFNKVYDNGEGPYPPIKIK